MKAPKTTAQRMSRVLELLTRQTDQLPETPEYGSWLLGRVSESQYLRRIRIQFIMTVVIVGTNLVGIGVVVILVTVAFPSPSVFADAPRWLTYGVVPGYVALALIFGTYWITRRTIKKLRWAIREQQPTPVDERNAFLAPWRVAQVVLALWGVAAMLFTVLYGMADHYFIPIIAFTVGVCGIQVTTACYLCTEFALRPVAAQALAAGPPPRRFFSGIMGRTMMVWLLSSGVPVLGIALTAIFALVLKNLTMTQFGIAVLIVALATAIFGFLLMWILSWLTAAPVRVVRAALRRVEQGNLGADLVVFDGTELGELQSGFNAMVHGLRERERVRDLFGRHVGREVAAAAERDRIQLGGEERHVAVLFVDIIGSTQIVTSKPATEVVTLLNRFFAVVVDEVDRHRGLINKFEGDATLAIFGAPNHLPQPEDEALAAGRGILGRLADEVPEIRAGIGVAAGQVVAGNVGAKERFEYTVIGEPVNEAARLSELAKTRQLPLLTTAQTLRAACISEQAHWVLGDSVVLRGYDQPTVLAGPL
ncbi:adenylate/guanylate cyclase domain-containing protein [Mycobacterium sp. pW045]|uniref:adenylate/guanylate cyclase domain-containing protein n=1 Tax=Mycobacterium sp. pW045 TaxID=3238984 RepID=UPI00351AEB4E